MTSLSTDYGEPRKENYDFRSLNLKRWKRRLFKDGIESPQVIVNRVESVDLDIYQGRDIPDFHKRKNRGELLPQTKYYFVNQTLKTVGRYEIIDYVPGGSAHIHSYYVPFEGTESGSISHPNRSFLWLGNDQEALPFDWDVFAIMQREVDFHGVDPAYLVQTAASKIYSKGWDAGTFFAELHKTVQLLREAAHRIANFYDEYVRTLGRRIFDPLSGQFEDAAFEQWLEGRYGWRLLAYDMQDIAWTLYNWDQETRTRWKERVGIDHTRTVDYSYNWTQPWADVLYSDICTYDIGVRGTVVADFMPARLQLNPVVTGWETVRYSFVIDWLLNVGQALQAISFLTLSDQYTASIGMHFEATRTGASFTTPMGGSTLDFIQTVDQSYEINYRRPVTVSYLPHFVNRLDVPKVIDLVALFLGLFSGYLGRSSIR